MGVTFDAPYVLKVASLVGKPIVFGDDVGFLTGADQLKFVDVVVATETDVVVVGYYFVDDGVVTGTDFISVWFVAGPAVEFTTMFGSMCNKGKFCLNILELKFGIFFIAPMTFDTDHFLLHPNFGRMRPFGKIF